MSDGGRFSAVERTSTVAQVAERLRHAVLDGTLEPGSPLREQALADELDVSRGSVREALRVLCAEGLAEHRTHRGVVVVELDADEAADVFRARVVLESAGARLVAADPDRWRAPIDDAVAAMGRAERRRDVMAFVDAHAAFHAALVAPLGSRRLDRFFAGLEGELRLHLARLERMSGSLRRSLAEHRAVAEALVAGDVDLAVKVVTEHLVSGELDVADDARGTV